MESKGITNNKISYRKYLPELAVILIFAILHIVVSCFHEGCFDEVHAWNIAKDGTLYEILFKVPYYEGHPALWHLILFPFAKLGISYKISMLFITTAFSVASVIILQLKAPFPRIVKFILPFTYFFFYQYGVIARPYCMMLAAFLLVAAGYEKRDEKPLKFTFALLFLCATSAFGTAVAGGISIVWMVKIFENSKNDSSFTKRERIKEFFRDRRTFCLMLLLIYALFFLVRVLPPNPYGGMSYTGVRKNGFLFRLLYLSTGLFSDLFFTDSYTHDFLADYTFDGYELTVTCVLGFVIVCGVVVIGRKMKTLAEFLIPFLILTIFSAGIYFCVHNSGILFCFILYWTWITYKKYIERLVCKASVDTVNVAYDNDLHGTKLDPKCSGKTIARYAAAVFAAFMTLSVVWSVSASITDIRYTYSFGEKEAQFIKDNGLEDASICFEWKTVRDESKKGSLDYYDMKHIINMDRLYAYLNDPDFVNWPFSNSLYLYFHSATTDDENTGIIENLKRNPKPDILIGEPGLDLLNGEGYDINEDYYQAFGQKIVKPWKNGFQEDTSKIYIKKRKE